MLGEAVPTTPGTRLPTGGGRLRLAVVPDSATRKTAGRSMREHTRAELACAAQATAAQRRRPASGSPRRSDRGSQCAADGHRGLLGAAGMRQPMGRHSDRLDDAPMGSSFHTLKVEPVHQRCWATCDGARRDVFARVEGRRNRRRIHSALGYRTPERMEQIAA